MGKIKKCHKCLLEVDEDTAICPRCDAELIAQAKSGKSKIRKCHQCLLEVNEFAANCPRCSAKLGPEAESEGKGKSYIGILLLILFVVILFTLATTIADYVAFNGSDAGLYKSLVISKDAKDLKGGPANVLKGWSKQPVPNALATVAKDIGIIRDSKFTRSNSLADLKAPPGMLAISTFTAGAMNRDVGIIRESLSVKKKWALPPRMQGLGGFGGSGGVAVSTFSNSVIDQGVGIDRGISIDKGLGISTFSEDGQGNDSGIVTEAAPIALIKNDKESKDKLITKMKTEGLKPLSGMGIDDIGYDGDALSVYVDLRFEDISRSEQEDAVSIIVDQWAAAMGQDSTVIEIRQFGTGKKLERWVFKQ